MQDARLLPGNDQAVLLAESLQVAAGHVLYPVQRLGIIRGGPHDQGIGLDGERRGAAEAPLQHRAGPLGHGHDDDHDRDDQYARDDQRGRRYARTPGPGSVFITAFDKGPETSGIRTRILLKLRHEDDCSWSAWSRW